MKVRIDRGISEGVAEGSREGLVRGSARGLVEDSVGSTRKLVEGSMEGSVKGLLEGLVTGLMIEVNVRGLSELMRTIGKGRRPVTKQGNIQDRRVPWHIFGLSGVQGNVFDHPRKGL